MALKQATVKQHGKVLQTENVDNLVETTEHLTEVLPGQRIICSWINPGQWRSLEGPLSLSCKANEEEVSVKEGCRSGCTDLIQPLDYCTWRKSCPVCCWTWDENSAHSMKFHPQQNFLIKDFLLCPRMLLFWLHPDWMTLQQDGSKVQTAKSLEVKRC